MEIPERPHGASVEQKSSSTYADELTPGRLSLLGLPPELRLRILRHLLVQETPLQGIPACRKSEWQPSFDPEDSFDNNMLSLYDNDWYSERDSHDGYTTTDSEYSQSLYERDLQVDLHRNVLFVNRQLYQEGSALLYQENALSIRLVALNRHRPNTGSVDISIFDLRRNHEIRLPYDDTLRHPGLLKFSNLHFDIKLGFKCYRARLRSILRHLVVQLNEKYESSAPRHISVTFRDAMSDPYLFDEADWSDSNFYCEACDQEDQSKCLCTWAKDARSEAANEAIKVLAPLKHLRHVKGARIVGLGNKHNELLAQAMILPNSKKPVDLCPKIALLLRYLDKLPDDDDTKRAAADQKLTTLKFPHRPSTEQKWKTDLLLADLSEKEVDDRHSRRRADRENPLSLAFHCPEWIRHDMKRVKKAMWRDDEEAFDILRKKVLERVNRVMLALQENVVMNGIIVDAAMISADAR